MVAISCCHKCCEIAEITAFCGKCVQDYGYFVNEKLACYKCYDQQAVK